MDIHVNQNKKKRSLPFVKNSSGAVPTDVIERIIYNHLVDVEEHYSIKNIQEISINARRSKIEIYSTTGDDLLIRLKGALTNTDPDLPAIKVASFKDGMLTSNLLHLEGLGYGHIENLSFSLFIPNSYQKKINLQTICSPVKIKELNAGELYLEGISGDLHLHQLLAKTSVIKSVSGKVEVEEAKGSVKIETISGDIKINLNRDFKDLHISSTTGNTEIKGHVKEEISLSHQTITGKFNTSFPIGSSTNIESNKAKIKLQSITGDFILN
ncbi:DUF4097 family beta strand repeat-containing protein [Alkaliphilus hydrothermalis]|uniref:DUF4097 and DUF4098 domain-containing protein YvlB n=1 Tax=Alkaliphilus hydrothermalis TaxID=1482730 RepID=A0ABS2NSN1_9FIRM|nr:DUF4097 family beta strand repeat-containing protein [Alkaliphilus hydrothermalis]MBM7615958.1 DUF4097 and DUF4098 domain-containing protein YvlB [Alkaliphilus hydrothermalis]